MQRLEILIVDHRAAARYRLRLMLRRQGILVRIADTAEQALTEIETCRPDAVFADRVLPAMNGLELLELLRSDPPSRTLPVVICCNDSDWPLRDHALRRGALALLDTSVAEPDLSRQLKGILADIVESPRPPRQAIIEQTHSPGEPSPNSESCMKTASMAESDAAAGTGARPKRGARHLGPSTAVCMAILAAAILVLGLSLI